MIAQLTLRMGHRHVVATLDDDFTWQCGDDLVTHSYLNAVFGPQRAAKMGGVPMAKHAATAIGEAGWDVSLELIAVETNVKTNVA